MGRIDIQQGNKKYKREKEEQENSEAKSEKKGIEKT